MILDTWLSCEEHSKKNFQRAIKADRIYEQL